MISKVISGGQVGADIAGLRAAQKLGIETGGYAPKGWQTTRGPQPALLKSFGLVEHTTPGYPQRTRMNVRNSDCTIRFAFNWDSGGERCTIREVFRYHKKFFDVNIRFDELSNQIDLYPPPTVLIDWLRLVDHSVINIAGNAAKRIEDVVEQYLLFVFATINKGESNEKE